jgi:hypothetical protein
VLKRTDREGAQTELRDSLDACTKLRQELLAVLERYDPEVLGIYGAARKGCALPAVRRRMAAHATAAIAQQVLAFFAIPESRPMSGEACLAARPAGRQSIARMTGLSEQTAGFPLRSPRGGKIHRPCSLTG